MINDLMVRTYVAADSEEWLRLRTALWPGADTPTVRGEMRGWLERSDAVVLVAQLAGKPGLVGFAELGARSLADGCETSPVAYLEGWYVDPQMRHHGIGAALIRAGEAWARSNGYREFASDAELENIDGQKAHLALGFKEVERAVLYLKAL